MLISGPSRSDSGAASGSTRRACSTANTAPTTPSAVSAGGSRIVRDAPRPRSTTRARPSSTRRPLGQRPLARAECLDHAHSGEGRLPVHQREQRGQPGARRVAPRGLAVVSGGDLLARAIERLLESREEAVFAVGEYVVEGLARHARPRDHLRDRHMRVTHLLHGLDRRGEHARTLDLGYVPAREAVGARAQRGGGPGTWFEDGRHWCFRVFLGVDCRGRRTEAEGAALRRRPVGGRDGGAQPADCYVRVEN